MSPAARMSLRVAETTIKADPLTPNWVSDIFDAWVLCSSRPLVAHVFVRYNGLVDELI